MTDTSQAEQATGQPQTNGFADDGLDDEERGKMRPADIDADVREMERRKRVEMIMNSRLFREELERIIESQMKEGGGGPGGLLQQLSDMMGPGVGRLQSTNMFRSPNCVVPINDIRGVESMGYAKGEKLLRCKLASVYRLIDLYGWTQGIHNHITARLNQDEEQFLVNPWGMLYHEVTASSLVKVDMQGNVVESGTTNFGVNREGFKLHAAIHSARPDIKCIIHTHTSSVVAVSSLKTGLLPLCHEALVIGEVSTHPYVGGIFDPEEQEKIARNLGPINKVLFLSNHGAVCCGETVEEAFFNVYNTVQACDTQVKLMPLGLDNLVLLPDESRKRVYDAARRPPEGHVLDKDKEVTSPTVADRKEKRWRVGGTEFEALMRMLDNAGFRTGYIYRNPLVKGDPPRPRNDIEVPPAVSSLGYLFEEEELYKQGGWKKFGKSHDRTRWLNSPNVYQKVEILETGTPDPKKITKWVDANADEWVADGSPTHSSTPVKINTLQFVPKNTNPKEFKKLQQQIKENRRADKITSGPQSHILEGVSWEEAKKMQDANISQTGDQVILVGAASKGIIQRGFQHNAMVYKAPYAKNPFDTVTEEELEEYKRAVDRKARGEHYDDSESEALSSSAAARPPTGKSPTSPTSETEEESRDEPRVLRIETKQAPRPIQAEVVLSDDSDYPDAVMERSKSARFPTKATPDLVTVPSGIGRSWSLGRNKRSSRANTLAPSSPRLHSASRHFHHARYVTLPVCEGPARPASPCPITRFSAVPEPLSRVTWPIPFEYPYPSYPTLSMSSSRSRAQSISSSVDCDSLADEVSMPCGASASSQSQSELFSVPTGKSVCARVTELPRVDRVVVEKRVQEKSGREVEESSDVSSFTNETTVVMALQQDSPMKVHLCEDKTDFRLVENDDSTECCAGSFGLRRDTEIVTMDTEREEEKLCHLTGIYRETDDGQMEMSGLDEEECTEEINDKEGVGFVGGDKCVVKDAETGALGFQALKISFLQYADLANQGGRNLIDEEAFVEEDRFPANQGDASFCGVLSGVNLNKSNVEQSLIDAIDGEAAFSEEKECGSLHEEEVKSVGEVVQEKTCVAETNIAEETTEAVVSVELDEDTVVNDCDETVLEEEWGDVVCPHIEVEEKQGEHIAEEESYCKDIREDECKTITFSIKQAEFDVIVKEDCEGNAGERGKHLLEEEKDSGNVSINKEEDFTAEDQQSERTAGEERQSELIAKEEEEESKGATEDEEGESEGVAEDEVGCGVDEEDEADIVGDTEKHKAESEGVGEGDEPVSEGVADEDEAECEGVAEEDEPYSEGVDEEGNADSEGVGEENEPDSGGVAEEDEAECEDVAEEDEAECEGVAEDEVGSGVDEEDEADIVGDAEKHKAESEAVIEEFQPESEGVDEEDNADSEGVAEEDEPGSEGVAEEDEPDSEGVGEENEPDSGGVAEEDEAECEDVVEEDEAECEDIAEGDEAECEGVDEEDEPYSESVDEEDNADSEGVAEEDEPDSEGVAEEDEPDSEGVAEEDKPDSEGVAEEDEAECEGVAEEDEAECEGISEEDEPESEGIAEEGEAECEGVSEEDEPDCEGVAPEEEGKSKDIASKKEGDLEDLAEDERKSESAASKEKEKIKFAASEEEKDREGAAEGMEDDSYGSAEVVEECKCTADEHNDMAFVTLSKDDLALLIREQNDNLALSFGGDHLENDGPSVASADDLNVFRRDLSMEEVSEGSNLCPRKNKETIISETHSKVNRKFYKEQDFRYCDEPASPDENTGVLNGLTFFSDTPGLSNETITEDDSCQNFNEVVRQAVTAACNAFNEYDESFLVTSDCVSFPQPDIYPQVKKPEEENLAWDFSDIGLCDEAVSIDGDDDSESLSSRKSLHFGDETPKPTVAFWDRGSLPCLSALNFATGRGERKSDTVSVTSWVDGEQYMREESKEHEEEADELSSNSDLEWSGAFTGENTYDEGSWSRASGRRKKHSCSSEGGKEALFDLRDAQLSDQFYSPLSLSSPDLPFCSPASSSDFCNPRTPVLVAEQSPSHKKRRRSSSVGDLLPVNTFQFSMNSSENMPKLSVTQTVSLTGTLTNKRVEVETTVVSDRDGGKCVMTTVTCSAAGVVKGRLHDNCAKTSPLELGRVFTLKKRRKIDS